MNNTEQRIRLLRDVEANMVPSGDKVTLVEGNIVQITQSLGGNHTVIINGNMAQISAENSDALGLKVEKEDNSSTDSDFSEKLVWDQLKTCYDPEIPVNIYDLGLIYTININEESDVDVKMSLTAPGCPVAGEMPIWVEEAIEPLPGVRSVKVELVWEPQWGMDMMSDEARLELGFM